MYEWDEFNKIKGCKNGRHTVIKEENPEFFKNDRGGGTVQEEGKNIEYE